MAVATVRFSPYFVFPFFLYFSTTAVTAVRSQSLLWLYNRCNGTIFSSRRLCAHSTIIYVYRTERATHTANCLPALSDDWNRCWIVIVMVVVAWWHRVRPTNCSATTANVHRWMHGMMIRWTRPACSMCSWLVSTHGWVMTVKEKEKAERTNEIWNTKKKKQEERALMWSRFS